MTSSLEPLAEHIIKLYKEGKSCEDIKQILSADINVGTRSIQRFLKAKGKIRSLKKARKLFHKKQVEGIKKFWQGHKKLRNQTSSTMRYKVMLRDNFTCVLCGGNKETGAVLTVDHIIPQFQGGKSTEDNLRTLCFNCNVGRAGVDYHIANNKLI
jgi:5-methylcytosine-specific restriction endonuclease McrA